MSKAPFATGDADAAGKAGRDLVPGSASYRGAHAPHAEAKSSSNETPSLLADDGLLGLLETIQMPVRRSHNGTVHDIDLLARIEGELRKNNAFQEALLEAMPLPVFYKDTLGRYTGCNSAFTKFLGKEKKDIVGKSVFEVSPQSFAHIYRDKDLDLLDNPLGFQVYESRVVYADGTTHNVIFHKARMVDDEGQPTGIIGVITDITMIKQAEVNLRIAATAFESHEAMSVTDGQGVILRINRAFTCLTGYTIEEAVGQTPRLLNSGRHDGDFYREMWETIHRTGGWRGEIWNRRKNGEVYPQWLTIAAVKSDEGIVTHYVGTHCDITERKIAEEKIKELAFFDPLTGLPNRALLLDRLKQAVTLSGRSETFGALLFIDLDHFKTLNDTLGHAKGDLLLQQVGQRLAGGLREGDTEARVGGDEFVVVLGALHESALEAANQTEAIGEKILAALGSTYLLGDIEYRGTASIGATLFRGHQTAIDDLLKQADLAMCTAKKMGRNALRFFDPAMQTVVVERAALEADLRKAIEENQFVLYYQAQVLNGDVTGAEALVRWEHPQRGMVAPSEFIYLAEETGLILSLGRWVLDTACTQLALWARRPELAHLTLAVNVSAHQFRQSQFVDQVLLVLKNTGANPQRLKLELTESLLVDNVQDVIEKMSALKAKGVGFSLDDFGTGYSSLSYLKRLPLDQLKIDQSFVRDVLTDPNDAAIAKTVVALAQSLGLGVIAEGVETEAQREFLASSGCHAYQGYFFSRPVPIAAFERLVLHL